MAAGMTLTSSLRSATPLASIRRLASVLSLFVLLASTGLALALSGPNVKIVTPVFGKTVTGSTIISSGTVLPDADMVAIIVTSKGEIAGKAVALMGNYDWNYQFTTDLDLDEEVTLYVIGKNSGMSTTETRTFHRKTK